MSHAFANGKKPVKIFFRLSIPKKSELTAEGLQTLPQACAPHFA
jgi:hypothetical protein